ncbi:MAG: M56 family metallopeptidase, partial [Bacteroidota bacterium]
MSEALMYFVKAQGVFTLLFCLWWISARRSPFHQLNRVILLSILAFSWLAPALGNLLPETTKAVATLPELEMSLEGWMEPPAEELLMHEATSPAKEFPISLLLGIVLLVLAIATVRLLLISVQVTGLVRRAKKYPGYSAEGIRYCETNGKEGPSSFFRWIFLPKLPAEEAILSHEKAHVQQGHSWDVLIAELWLCLSWWNPMAYAYLGALRQVHEYLADATALQRVPVEEYLRTLAAHAEVKVRRRSGLAPALTHASLTKRLYMMKKRPTTTRHRAAYAVLIPGMVLSLWAFRPTNEVAPSVGTWMPPIVLMETPSFLMQTTPDGNPIADEHLARLSSTFGIRTHPITKERHHHWGIDFAARSGSPILATGDGEVIETQVSDEGYGGFLPCCHSL